MNKIFILLFILLLIFVIFSVLNTNKEFQKYYSQISGDSNIEIKNFKTLSTSYTEDFIISYGLTNFN